MTAEHYSANLLHRFRSTGILSTSGRRLPLHPLEKAVLTVVAVHLCFLPWALGTMHAWSQQTSLGLSLAGLGLALVSRDYPTELSGGPAFRYHPWVRLVRFPVFWIGLALLGYIVVQALNPFWVWERNATTWWLRRVNDIPWLPASIDTPFERFNVWRQFFIYASAWLTVCTVWTGFIHRRSLRILLTILALNGIALAATGFLGRFYFPTWEWVLGLNDQLSGASSFASFIYKNHAAAYLALMVGVAITLAAWHHEHGLRLLARSSPGMLWAVGSVVIATAVLFTYSRGATLILVGYLVLAAALLLGIRLTSPTHSATSPLVWLLLAVLVVGIAGYGARQLSFHRAESTFTSLFREPEKDISVVYRLDAYAAGRTMLADHWQRGVGAGGFRHLFPEYVKHYPNIYRDGRIFWENAHCDWLQFPIELGSAGSLLLLLAGLSGMTKAFRLKLWLHPSMLLLAFACMQTLAQAVFDFPLQNPAVLLTWCSLLAIALRWAELDPLE